MSFDQGDVLIEARRAGDIVGATPMDRCEDVEPNQNTGKVYVNCTKNPRRGNDGKPAKDAPNPRNHNEAGHVIELIPTNGHSADTMSWEILLLAGKDGQYGILEGSDTLDVQIMHVLTHSTVCGLAQMVQKRRWDFVMRYML